MMTLVMMMIMMMMVMVMMAACRSLTINRIVIVISVFSNIKQFSVAVAS